MGRCPRHCLYVWVSWAACCAALLELGFAVQGWASRVGVDSCGRQQQLLWLLNPPCDTAIKTASIDAPAALCGLLCWLRFCRTCARVAGIRHACSQALYSCYDEYTSGRHAR